MFHTNFTVIKCPVHSFKSPLSYNIVRVFRTKSVFVPLNSVAIPVCIKAMVMFLSLISPSAKVGNCETAVKIRLYILYLLRNLPSDPPQRKLTLMSAILSMSFSFSSSDSDSDSGGGGLDLVDFLC